MLESRSLALAVSLALVACGGTQSPSAGGVEIAPDATSGPTQGRVDPVAERSVVAALVQRRWQSISSGAFEQADAALAPDALEWGTGPGELMLSRDASIANLHHLFDPVLSGGGHLEMRSQGADVHIAPDGRSAWFSDFPSFRVMEPGRPETGGTLRATGFAVRGPTGWSLTASHVSIGATTERTVTETWTPLAAVPEQIAPDAQSVAGTFRIAMSSIDSFGSQFADTGELIGTSPTEHIVGAVPIQQYLRQIVALSGAIARVRGGMRAAMAPGGEAGWVAANVEVSGRGPRGMFVAPLRVLAIYAVQNGVGRIVQMHWSHGIQ